MFHEINKITKKVEKYLKGHFEKIFEHSIEVEEVKNKREFHNIGDREKEVCIFQYIITRDKKRRYLAIIEVKNNEISEIYKLSRLIN